MSVLETQALALVTSSLVLYTIVDCVLRKALKKSANENTHSRSCLARGIRWKMSVQLKPIIYYF